MKHSKKGREIHTQAEIAREKEQDFTKALNLLDKAAIQYAKDKDYYGLPETQNSRFLCFSHLYQQTKNANFLTMGIYAAKTSVKIAKDNNAPKALTLAYHSLAKAYEDAQKYSLAAKFFSKALTSMEKHPPADMHNRPAVKSDIKTHLGFSQYMSGDKSGLKMMLDAIAELKQSNEFQYTKDVWLSGAHMRAALALAKDNPTESKKHLAQAKEIIDSNSELKLRKKQLEILISQLAS